MAAVPVTFQGILFFSDVGVGGGPMPGGPSAPGGGGQPPQIWGGSGQPYPDAGFPGPQPGGPTHIWGGPFDPPRVWGGKPPYMDIGGPGPQPGGPIQIWGPIGDYIDAGFPAPQPPLPPTLNERPVEWKAGWSQATGWVVVGVPTGAHPTPSAKT